MRVCVYVYVYKTLQEPYGKIVKTGQLIVLLHKRKRLYCQIKYTQSNGLIKYLLKLFMLWIFYFIQFVLDIYMYYAFFTKI